MGKNQSVANFLGEADVLIEGTLADPQITAALSEYGYDAARLESLRTLLSEARTLTSEQAAKYGQQHAATAEITRLREEADTKYKTTRRLTRLALEKNPDARRALLLDGPRPRSTAGWIHQASVFYANLLANPNFQAALTRFGYTPEKLSAEQKMIQAVQLADENQEQSKGNAVGGTKERDAKLDELGKETSDLKAVARIILTHEQLTKLGLTGRNTSAGGGAATPGEPPVGQPA